jgi:hypothetical protein
MGLRTVGIRGSLLPGLGASFLPVEQMINKWANSSKSQSSWRNFGNLTTAADATYVRAVTGHLHSMVSKWPDY